LNYENIGLTAIGPELHTQAVVAEARSAAQAERQFEVPANLPGQIYMGVAAEDDDCSHDVLLRGQVYQVAFSEFGFRKV
jgi:hypothetical protein